MAANTTNQPSPTAGFPIRAADFNSKQAKHVNKLIDYYEGRQKHHLCQILDGKGDGFGKRTDWKEKGMVPRSRNITKSIVDKSGLLYNRPPKLAVAIQKALGTVPQSVTDPIFQQIMESADWLEFFQNVDAYTRLTKSTVVLLQKYIPTERDTVNGQYAFDESAGDALILQLLHQGNSVVKMNPARTQITALAFLTDFDNDGDEHGPYTQGVDKTSGKDEPEKWSYRLVLPDEIIDVLVEATGSYGTPAAAMQETIVNRAPNPDGIVPAAFFYDINKPRTGYWVQAPEDLKDLQEMLNLHLTDMEYAMAWNKAASAVITGDIKNNDDNRGSQIIPSAPQGHTEGGALWNEVPFYQQKTITNLGGLGSVIKVGPDAAGGAGKLEFVAPRTDLKSLQDIMGQLTEDVANDWDVNLKYGGGGSATSGFQLVVEENNNLTLRQKRKQSAVAGWRRFYQIAQQLYPGQLTEGMMQVEFAEPNLPVNQEEQERIWSDKIDNNRASPVDYFMVVQGMTKEEAQAKLDEVIGQNNAMNKAIVPPAPPAPAVVTPGENADKTLVPVRQDQNNG